MRPPCRETEVNAWWWVPIGLVAWFAVAVAAGLWLGPVLRSCSQAREALEARTGEIASRAPGAAARHWRQASYRRLERGRSLDA